MVSLLQYVLCLKKEKRILYHEQKDSLHCAVSANGIGAHWLHGLKTRSHARTHTRCDRTADARSDADPYTCPDTGTDPRSNADSRTHAGADA